MHYEGLGYGNEGMRKVMTSCTNISYIGICLLEDTPFKRRRKVEREVDFCSYPR